MIRRQVLAYWNVRNGKLVRDRIPQIIAASGRTPVTRILQGHELLDALLVKLDEEAAELRTADKQERTEELADVFEVVRTLATSIGLSMPAPEDLAAAKRAERGGSPAEFSCTRRSTARDQTTLLGTGRQLRPGHVKPRLVSTLAIDRAFRLST